MLFFYKLNKFVLLFFLFSMIVVILMLLEIDLYRKLVNVLKRIIMVKIFLDFKEYVYLLSWMLWFCYFKCSVLCGGGV